MATIQYVVNAIDNASATFARIAGAADDGLPKIDDLGRKSATARIGLSGDKATQLAIADIELKLARLGQRVAKPDVTVQGLAAAQVGILRLSLALDKLNAKSVAVNGGQGIWSLLSGAFGGGGGAAAGAAGSAGQAGAAGAPGIAGALANPVVGIPAAAAALAALPFVAQAAATGITFVLGGALTGLGVAAAAGTRSVGYQFSQLSASAKKDFAGLGSIFGPVIT